MATIPVEKKSGFPWWLAILGLVLAALLLWWLLPSDDDDTVAVTTNNYETVAVNGAVDMDDLVVTELTGDMSFKARAQNGETYFIVFDEVATPGIAKEGRYDINVGDTLDIEGTLRARDYTLPATVNATIPMDNETFVYATSIDK